MARNSGGDSVATAPREKWEGGFVRRTKAGARVYVIERHVGGQYFKASTRCRTLKAAMKELERFELDPWAYKAALTVERLELTDDLVIEYEAHLVKAGNTANWASICRRMLADWLEDFAGLDLRSLSAAGHILPALRSRPTTQHHRVAALKGFFRWLRVEKGLMKHAEDATLDVETPKAGSSRLSAPRDVPVDDVRKVAAFFATAGKTERDTSGRLSMLDTLAVLVGTGWHVSEVRRFAAGGEIRKDPTGKHLGVLVTWHKRKERASTFVQLPETLEAAQRLRAAGKLLSDNVQATRMREACVAVGVDLFHLGDMRHSTSTWATEDGADPTEVSRALNHSSPKMTRQVYIRHSIPLGVMPVRGLRVAQ